MDSKLQGVYEGLKISRKIIKGQKNKENALEIIESHLSFLEDMCASENDPQGRAYEYLLRKD